jgi:nicotinamidase/pyrazinamidase
MPVHEHDALILVDAQNDFLPVGALAVVDGDKVIPVLNRYLPHFDDFGLTVVASRDWHPVDHCSFIAQGGQWPPHCLQDSAGAAFPAALKLPADTVLISKGRNPKYDAYSAFEGTDLARQLHARDIKRLFVGGLATDYCVVETVCDGLKAGFDVVLLQDAIRSVEIYAGDGARAIERMRDHGADTYMLDQ